MSDTPDLSTLPKRMMYAANVIDEVNLRADIDWFWNGDSLRLKADKLEIEDEVKAIEFQRQIELHRQIDLLADSLNALDGKIAGYWFARHLVRSGWRKGDSV